MCLQGVLDRYSDFIRAALVSCLQFTIYAVKLISSGANITARLSASSAPFPAHFQPSNKSARIGYIAHARLASYLKTSESDLSSSK